MTREDLIAFEDEMAALFNAGQIKAPLHLAGGNEEALIEIFREIRPQDWVLCSWRSHYHCLLKGVSPFLLKQKILEGRSIALCFKDQRVLSSAIVGGICPIAVGLAWGIKERGADARVWCFIGDMTAESGIYHESYRYAFGHGLPITWVEEDNGLSVCTDTRDVWGKSTEPTMRTRQYRYTLDKPHVGTGTFVSF